MRLKAVFTYRLSNGVTTGAVFRRILAALGEPPRLEFYLSDSPFKASATTRVLATFPQLGAFATRTKEDLPALQKTSPDGAPLDLEAIAAIADGIPKPFPFHFATFHFPDIPGSAVISEPFNGWDAEFPDRVEGPGVTLTSNWWTSRRLINLQAIVPIDVPRPDSVKIAGPPEEVLTRLKSLGSCRSRLSFEPGPSDQPSPAELDALRQIRELWQANLQALLGEILPHALPAQPGLPQGSGLTSPHKKSLVSVFGKRGWKYWSPAQGIFQLSKRGAGNLSLSLHFDVGSWSHHCVCLFSVGGLGWSSPFVIQFVKGVTGQYFIVNDTAWAAAIENIAAVVDHFEAAILPEILTVMGPAPAWFGASL